MWWGRCCSSGIQMVPDGMQRRCGGHAGASRAGMLSGGGDFDGEQIAIDVCAIDKDIVFRGTTWSLENC